MGSRNNALKCFPRGTVAVSSGSSRVIRNRQIQTRRVARDLRKVNQTQVDGNDFRDLNVP